MQVSTGALCEPLICIFQSVCLTRVGDVGFEGLLKMRQKVSGRGTTANQDVYRCRFSLSSKQTANGDLLLISIQGKYEYRVNTNTPP